MKKLFLFFALAVPLISFSQKIIGNPADSAINLIRSIESNFGLKLILRERSDPKENYLYKDSTGFVNVTLNMKTDKSMQGVKVITTPDYIDYVVITGPSDLMDKLFENHFRKSSDVVDQGKYYVHAQKWEAVITDHQIRNNEGVEMPGKVISVNSR